MIFELWKFKASFLFSQNQNTDYQQFDLIYYSLNRCCPTILIDGILKKIVTFAQRNKKMFFYVLFVKLDIPNYKTLKITL